MQATCSVTLQNQGHFLVAQTVIVSPPDLGPVDTGQPYEQLSVHHPSPYEAPAWQFVVTKDGATPVAAAEADATEPADHMAPDWTWTSSASAGWVVAARAAAVRATASAGRTDGRVHLGLPLLNQHATGSPRTGPPTSTCP